MAKRSAVILAVLLTLALAAFGAPGPSVPPIPSHAVPEPGSLLVFGSGLLLSFKALMRRA